MTVKKTGTRRFGFLNWVLLGIILAILVALAMHLMVPPHSLEGRDVHPVSTQSGKNASTEQHYVV